MEHEGINGVFKTIWVSSMSLVCTSAAHEATHWPGRIAMLGVSIRASSPDLPRASMLQVEGRWPEQLSEGYLIEFELIWRYAGFAFFIYVVVTLYVSNLAAFLILKPGDSAAISNLPEIARLGGKLCLLEAMSGLYTNSLMPSFFLPFLEEALPTQRWNSRTKATNLTGLA